MLDLRVFIGIAPTCWTDCDLPLLRNVQATDLKPVFRALEHARMTLLPTTITFGGSTTDMLKGSVHLVLFAMFFPVHAHRLIRHDG